MPVVDEAHAVSLHGARSGTDSLRIAVGPGLTSRNTALQDAKFAINAMKLSQLQEQSLVRARARFAPSIRAYVARLNALEKDGVSPDDRRATEDTLKAILVAEHASADSLISADQKQRYLNALRQVRGAAVVNPADVRKATVKKATTAPTLVPVP